MAKFYEVTVAALSSLTIATLVVSLLLAGGQVAKALDEAELGDENYGWATSGCATSPTGAAACGVNNNNSGGCASLGCILGTLVCGCSFTSAPTPANANAGTCGCP
jgi:hypothetical protein